MKKKEIRIFCIISIMCFILISMGYLGNYYHTNQEEVDIYLKNIAVKIEYFDNGSIVMDVENAKCGFIFYPGGKVEHTAYIPLMANLANRGIMCVLVKMPFHLAVFDINAAESIVKQYPQIDSWYIGGHSLGGAMAASYLSDCTNDFDGLVLLGAYSTEDLSEKKLEVLSVYGSEDRVLNREKYEQNQANLPNKYKEIVLKGGCHAYFGMYGEQEGDGTATITNTEQIQQTADAILALILNPNSNSAPFQHEEFHLPKIQRKK